MTCPFCEDPGVKKRIVTENAAAFALPTNIPIVPGHIIICSRRHILRYEDLTLEEMASMEELRVKIKLVLIKVFGAEGFNYAWNEGSAAGQSIPHFHLHVLPRKEGDKGVYEYDPREFIYRPGPRPESPEEELDEVAELIKKNLYYAEGYSI